MITADVATLLGSFIELRRNLPFIWGTHDCCQFSVDWIEHVTGRRVDDTRNRYHDAASSGDQLRGLYGTDDLIAVATQLLGEPLASPLLACRGDVLAFRRLDMVFFGLCMGIKCVAVGKKRLVTLPLSSAIAAWRIV
ncbi:MAG: hypothetical protein WCK65_09815 [Rhodospirillaceae bacterium]